MSAPGTLHIVDHGIPFLLRIVRAGDRYGLDDCLTHPHKRDSAAPLVEFYDSRHPHTPRGQFVSRYYVDTILGRDRWGTGTGGLCLDGGNASVWFIGEENMARVRAWLAEELGLAPPALPPGSLDAVAMLRVIVDSASLTDGVHGYECVPGETMRKARALLKGLQP